MAYIENKYKKWYDTIVLNASLRNWTRKTAPCYTERHHIVPKSLGGLNDKSNLVYLTAKEHYIAHLLLTKCTKDISYKKMMHALNRMMFSKTVSQERIYSSNQYNNVRSLWAKYWGETRKGISPTNKGGTHTDEAKYKIKQARATQVITDETKQKWSNTRKNWVWMYCLKTLKNTRVDKEKVSSLVEQGFVVGRHWIVSQETKQKLSLAAKAQWNNQKAIKCT
jgi:hypothetical protein